MIKRVDENGNVRLITNIRKPRKWRRYEYLLSSGTLWINTKVNGYMNHRYELDYQQTGTGSYRIWGVFGQAAWKGYNMSITYSSGRSVRWSSTSNGETLVDNIDTISNTTRHTFIIDKGQIYYDGVNKGKSAGHSDSCVINYPIYLFTVNPANTTPTANAIARVYSYKDYNEAGTLIRHLVPAQYNGLYGMWDLVEDKFYGNSGTGTFTVGPEIKNYDEINKVRKTFSLLPAGVELYDYILSSGTLWIDTGYLINSSNLANIKMYADFTATTTYVGNRWWSNGLGGGSSGLVAYVGIGGGSTSNTPPFTYGNGTQDINTGINGSLGTRYIYTLDLKNKTYKITDVSNNVLVDLSNFTVNTPSQSQSPTLFAWKRGNTGVIGSCFSGIFYNYKLYDNNQLVRNLIPCTYLGEPGMWDTVENKFYRNQGTGLFTLGNKITLKEYEYLSATKGPYINTGYCHSATTSIDLDAAFNTLYSYNTLLGAATSDNSSDSFCFGTQANGGLNCDLTRGFNVISGTAGKLTAGTKFNVKLDVSKAILNGVTYTTGVTTGRACLYAMAVFGRNLSNSYSSEIGDGKVYELKIYDSPGVLVRDFIPISYNGTPGLWDKVEWKFYGNAGSGSFTLGPEKKSGIFPISFGTLEYSEGSNISSSLLTVTGSGKTSTPVRAANNACTSGYKVEFSNVSVAKTYVIELDFTWAGNWGFTSDGNPRLFFLGPTKVSGGSYEWKGTNYITISLNNRQSLLRLVQSSPSGGRYHYIGVFTIPANDRVGYSIETRCDYSDGNGSFTYGNLKIYSYN